MYIFHMFILHMHIVGQHIFLNIIHITIIPIINIMGDPLDIITISSARLLVAVILSLNQIVDLVAHQVKQISAHQVPLRWQATFDSRAVRLRVVHQKLLHGPSISSHVNVVRKACWVGGWCYILAVNCF